MLQPMILRCLLPIATLISIDAVTPADAQTIYRCEQDGRTIYTDSPCSQPAIRRNDDTGPTASAGAKQTVVGGGYENPYGPWRGEAQYQVRNIGLRSDGTHSVVPLIIEISEDGKVIGASAKNGCRMLGIASPGLTPKMLNLDATLSNCAASDMNRRYHGSLVISTADRTARLNLRAQQIGIGTGVLADVKAVMRR